MPQGLIPEDDPRLRKPLINRETALETALLGGGLVLFIVLLFELRTPVDEKHFLNPPLIAGAGLILLWPLRKQTTVRALLLAGGFLLLAWFLSRIGSVVLPFVVVYLLAYLADPLVQSAKDRWGLSRSISSLAVTLAMVGVFSLLVLILVPSVLDQIKELAQNVLGSVVGLRTWLESSRFITDLERAGVVNKQEIIGQITSSVQEQASKVTTLIPTVVQGVFGYAGSLIGLITTLALVPVLLYYTVKDYPFIKRRLVELFPTFGGQRAYLNRAGDVVGSYLRGQIIISAIGAFNVTVVLLLFNVPFALLIGLLAGILNMIPNLGAVITNVLGIIIAVIFGDPWFLDALVVFLTLLGQSILESTVLTPKILSTQVGLHPVLILLSLFVFGYFLGIFGFFIAVPTTALLMAYYKAYRNELTLELATDKTPPTGRILRRRAYSDWAVAGKGGIGQQLPGANEDPATPERNTPEAE